MIALCPKSYCIYDNTMDTIKCSLKGIQKQALFNNDVTYNSVFPDTSEVLDEDDDDDDDDNVGFERITTDNNKSSSLSTVNRKVFDMYKEA